ncbi:LicD family protein [Candidatus Saccharibacteria bacterium]|nr:LicD family protein [Candidatus Saccharibacteria bacterium]
MSKKNAFSLKAETRCDYHISTKMKKIWKIELDMLQQVIDICKKHDLKYSLAGGSLIGAVRHKGFIPWDDDIDVVMPRNDYNRFIEIAEKELKEPYFVQNYRTEPKYYRGQTQIRNSNTTAMMYIDCFYNFNCGIFIDIFPLDNIPDDPAKKKRFMKKISFIRRFCVRPVNNPLKTAFQKIFRPSFFIKWLNRAAQQYKNEKTKTCGAVSHRPDEFKYERKWIEEFIEVPFENMTVSISKYYDEWLTRQYGDYMKLPKERGNGAGNLHGKVFFDPDKSYREYESKKDELKKIL